MKTFIIAEVGQAHDGSLGILHSYIDAIAPMGVDAIKFQTHIAEAESSILEPFRVPFSYEDKTRFDYWKRMAFTEEQWASIKTHCEKRNVEFISSPFSNQAVALLEKLAVKRYKIGSGEVSNLLILQKIAQTKKAILLSTGMSNFAEIDQAVIFLRSFGNPLTLLQCTSMYPVPPEKVGLNVMGLLQEKYNCPVGLSDHSGEIYNSLAAVSLGAQVIEVHVVFDKRMFGPDSSSSLTLSQLQDLVRGIRHIDTVLSHPVDKNTMTGLENTKPIFEKSLAVNQNLPAGYSLSFEDLEAKKPANQGIPAALFKQVLGKKLTVPKKAWEFLHQKDIE